MCVEVIVCYISIVFFWDTVYKYFYWLLDIKLFLYCTAEYFYEAKVKNNNW